MVILLKNGYIKLVKGSDSSSIHGLTIINDKVRICCGWYT